MEYQTVEETAERWGITARQVRTYCTSGRIAGAIPSGRTWRIPVQAEKPVRKSRHSYPKTVLGILDAERKARLSGGLYHQLQIDFAYNSNHMEGSRLSHEQTRWIFETQTVGELSEDISVDDIVETANHFRAVDEVIRTAGAALTEAYIKRLHEILKSGTTDSRRAWFVIGDYKRLANTVGDRDTVPPARVRGEMANLLAWYGKTAHTFDDLAAFHVRIEAIHPFQDGNGRVGRLILLKECLKYNIIPMLVLERTRRFYYMGLQEWQTNETHKERLLDTFRAGQDYFEALLRRYGHDVVGQAESR